MQCCAGLEGPIIGLFENAAMIVLLAALMLFAAFWLPFTIGRCVLSALAGLQLDHASLVLKAMAHDPAQLRSGALAHTAPRAPGSAAPAQEDAAGLAAAVMVLERVLMVHPALGELLVCIYPAVRSSSSPGYADIVLTRVAYVSNLQRSYCALWAA